MTMGMSGRKIWGSGSMETAYEIVSHGTQVTISLSMWGKGIKLILLWISKMKKEDSELKDLLCTTLSMPTSVIHGGSSWN
jgi:hypothetical protein